MRVLREVRVARRYFVGSQYHDAAMVLLEGLASDTPEQTAAKMQALPTDEELFARLTERLKGKSVIKNLRKLGEGRESPLQKSIALSSLLTHVLIETSSHKEYGTLISSVTRALVESLDENASFGHLFEEIDPPATTGNETEEEPALAEDGEENTLMSFGSGKYYYLVKKGDDLKVVDALGVVQKEGHGDVADFVRPIMGEFGDLVSRDFLEKYGIMTTPELPPLAAPGEGPDGKPLPAGAAGGGSGAAGGSHGGSSGMPPPESQPSADGEMPSGDAGAPTNGPADAGGDEPPPPQGEDDQPVTDQADPVEAAPEPQPPAEGEPAAEEPPAPAGEEPPPADEPAAPAEEFTPEEKEEIDRQARRARK